ncbi:MAG: cation transporter [Trueperaceae bacterium]|nr:cation transporter [Trueperaceae bacterium]
MDVPPFDPGRQRERTLAIALLLSLAAPFATGYAALISRSATQLADFVRRSVEFVALTTSWAVVRQRRRRPDLSAGQVRRLERRAAQAVAAALAVSGLVTLVVAGGRARTFAPGGDVRLGLLIAGLGLVTNAAFWRRYARLQRLGPNAVIEAQRRLYAAKVAADGVVVVALATVWLAPDHPAARPVDLVGSLAVALYLLVTAVQVGRSVRRSVGRPTA